MPLTKEGKPVLYKPWKNTTTSKNKFWVYVKSDTKKGFKAMAYSADEQDLTNREREQKVVAEAKAQGRNIERV